MVLAAILLVLFLADHSRTKGLLSLVRVRVVAAAAAPQGTNSIGPCTAKSSSCSRLIKAKATRATHTT